MDLTKRLGFSQDLLQSVADVLGEKKIVHPNQKEISAAAPPNDEITAADFKALKAKKKTFKVEGVDRKGKTYESPIFEDENDAVAFARKIQYSGALKSVNITSQEVAEDVVVIDIDAETVEESKEVNTTNASAARDHDCAKHVVHEEWGSGQTIPTMHAEPDAEGNIAWYDVMFEHGIEQQVSISNLEVVLSEKHKHKFMKEDELEIGDEVELLPEGYKVGDFVNATNPNATPRYKITGKTNTHYTLKSGDKEMQLPKERVARVNKKAWDAAKQSPEKYAKRVTATKSGFEMNPVHPKPMKEESEINEAMDKSMAYATGTKQAMKKTGDTPPLGKPTIKKAHSIAKAILRNEEVSEEIQTHVFHAYMKPTDTRSHKMVGRNASEPVGKAPKAEKLILRVKATDAKDARNKVAKHITKNYGASGVTDLTYKGVNEEVEETALIEGRNADPIRAHLDRHEGARKMFSTMTGGKGRHDSYFHVNPKGKFRKEAEAAVAQHSKTMGGASSAGGSDSEAPDHADADSEASQHPIHKLRSIMDRNGGTFMGHKLTRGHAAKLVSQHDALKPSQRSDFVTNIGTHVKNVVG
jgi:hypothetical protein